MTGDIGNAALTIAPKAASNLAKGVDMLNAGAYRDAKGYNVIQTTPGEAFSKALGFQPGSVAKIQEANAIHQREKNFYAINAAEIRAKWARGIFEKDPDMVAEARDALADWNEKNPDQRISPNMPAIMKKVREMGKSKDQRIADTAPKAMRAEMRRENAQVREGM
ncbi:PLxRFG domain-containing protein [Curvibacter sp. HBC61]|uniref:PLxRFG domain-containing protein n=1 Tax=Curvibacter cyanobacteriorum TaxID=3026422 RepID=A0ABT5MVT4_9BURK|nr:PLxRFG domain-containing protein [Curvibacter sp. HBC61]MDD0837928.1 PLxRFG domain-containing protein [Curvibacter sp. HBC61]